MTTRRIFLKSEAPFDWLLFHANGEILRRGKDALGLIPLAEKTEIVIPADWVGFFSATLPAGNRKQVIAALPYLIEDQLIDSPEEMHVVIAEASSDRPSILASIAKHTLKRTLETLDLQGIQPNRIIPASLCTPFDKDSWLVVLEGDTGFVRMAEHKGLAIELDDGATPPLALQLALKEAEKNQQLPQVISVYSDRPLDLNVWSQTLSIPCIISNDDWKATPPNVGVNLLQGEFAPLGKSIGWLHDTKPAMWLLAGVLSISLIASVIDWTLKSFENQRLEEAMRQVFLDTFPDTKNIVDAPLQMQRKLAELQHATGDANSTDFLPLLAHISNHVGSIQNVIAMRYTQNRITLTLSAENSDSAKALALKYNVPGRIAVVDNIRSSNEGVVFDLIFEQDGE